LRKIIRSFFSFGAAVALLVAGLRLLNGVPLLVQEDLLRTYGDLDEVRSALRIAPILVPSYFPQDLSWPPAAILAQGRPFPVLVMEFERSGGGRETALVIVQADADRAVAGGRIRIERVRESAGYSLKGRDAVLDVGACRDGGPCSRISWREGRYRIDVTARSAPFELIEIAESMVR
jgi:hypothetical protein